MFGYQILPQLEAAADAFEADRRVVTGLDEAAAAAGAAELLPAEADDVEGANLALPLRPPLAALPPAPPLVEGESVAGDPEAPLPRAAVS